MIKTHAAAMALSTAAALAFAAPAHAAPDWLAPFTLADPVAQSPDLALDGAGDAFVAWKDAGLNAFVRTKPAGGALTAPRALSGGATEAPVVAANAKGDAIVAWVEADELGPPRIGFARGGAGGFGNPEAIVDPGDTVDELVATIDASGAALLAWTVDTDTASRIRTAVIPPGGAPVSTFVSDEAGNAFAPSVAANGTGAALVAWVQERSDTVDATTTTATQLQVSRRPAAGTAMPAGTDVGAPALSTETELSDGSGVNTTGEELTVPAAALDDLGGAIVAVQRVTNSPGALDDGEDDVQTGQIDASLGAIGSGLGPLGRVSPPGQDTTEPVLAVDGGGQAVLAWTSAAGTQLDAASRAPGSTFGDLETLATVPADRLVGEPTAAVRAAGEELVGWVDADAEGVGTITVAQRPPGGDFAPRAVSTPGTRTLSPVLAADGDGNAVAAWQTDPDPNADDESVQAAAFDGAAPRVTAFVAPQVGSARSDLAFGVAGRDAWSPFTVRWDFGDGTKATGENVFHAFGTAGRYGVTATLTDSLGNARSTDPASVDVGPAGAPPPAPPEPAPTPVAAAAAADPPDTVRPVVGSLTLRDTVFRVGDGTGPFVAAGSARAASLRRGSSLRFTLSEPARVQITVSRLVVEPGRRSRCVALGAPPRGRATSIGRVGTVATAFPAGATTIPFSGRIGRRALARGRYAIRVQAIDAAGNVSRVREVRVTIC